MSCMLYFSAFDEESVDKLAICLRSLYDTQRPYNYFPRLLFMCNSETRDLLRHLEFPDAFDHMVCEIEDDRMARYRIFEIIASDQPVKKALYVDPASLFSGDVRRAFDLLEDDGVLYCKYDDKNTLGLLGFVCGSKTRALMFEFSSWLSCMPGPRDPRAFIESCVGRPRCIDLKALDLVSPAISVFLSPEQMKAGSVKRERALFHACIVLTGCPTRLSNYCGRIRPLLQPNPCRMIDAINGREERVLESKIAEMFPGRAPPTATLYEKCAAAAKMSHVVALREFLTSGADHGIILEDDAVPDKSFNSALERLLDSLPGDYDMLCLYSDTLSDDPCGVVPGYTAGSSGAYVVSRSGAAAIVGASVAEMSDASTDAVCAELCASRRLRSFCATRRCVENAGQPSQGSEEGMASNIWNDRY